MKQKRLLAIALCLVMVGAFAGTSAVSAKNGNNIVNSSIRQYDVLWTNNEVVGKVILDGETGHYVVNVNLAKAGLKDKAQGHVYLWVVLWNSQSFKGTTIQGYGLLIPTFVNAAGIAHVEATDPLVQQWFGGGAVDGASTLTQFYAFDVFAGAGDIIAV